MKIMTNPRRTRLNAPTPSKAPPPRPACPMPPVAPSPPASRVLLNIGQVAQRLQTTRQHVGDLIDEDRLEAINVGLGRRKHWRVPLEALDRFLAQNRSFQALESRPGR